MRRFKRFMAGWLLLAAATSLAVGQDSDRDRILRAKQSTALLLAQSEKAAATATCISESGVFVTNLATVSAIGRGGSASLVLNPNEENESTVSAKVVQLFEREGVAILQADPSRKYRFLALGDDTKLVETTQVTGFGFPVDRDIFVEKAAKPNVRVSVCRITSLDKKSGKLQSIQLDCEFPAGSSGGPIIDSGGRLIGMIRPGVSTAVLPVSQLKALVLKPEVLVSEPKDFTGDGKFQVELVWPFGDLRDLSVDFRFEKPDGSGQSVKAKSLGLAKFEFATPASMRRRPTETKGIPATIQFTNAQITCRLVDRTFQIAGKTYRVSSVSKFVFLPAQGAIVTLRSGSRVSGNIVGLNGVPIDLGGYTVELDLHRAQQIEVRARSESQLPVAYTIIVKRQNSEINRLRVDLNIPDEPLESTNAGPRLKPFTGSDTEVIVTEGIRDVVVGRAGRYLLLMLKSARKVAVYDANDIKVVRKIALKHDNAMITAGIEHFFVAYPEQGLIERWSLRDFERDMTAKLPIQGTVRAMSMGSASNGPLLIHWSSRQGVVGRPSFTFFNVHTLKPIVIGPFRPQNINVGDNVHMRAAAGGDVFGIWCTNRSPQGMETLLVSDSRVSLNYERESAGYVVPTFDGTAILTQTRGVHSLNLRRKRSTPLSSEIPCLLSTHDRYYISVPIAFSGRSNRRGGTVNRADTGESVVPIPILTEFAKISGRAWNQNDFTFDKRILYIVQADQIVSIPLTNDRLKIRRFNLGEALRKSNREFVYITSIPSPRLIPGEIYQYLIEVASSDKNIKFELIDGPDGVTISETGELLWTVPANWSESMTRIVVSVANGAGETTYQTLKLRRYRD